MSNKLVLGRDGSLLYGIAQLVAENDSIGEGYGYCHHYTKAIFLEEIKEIEEHKEFLGGNYLNLAVEIYDLAKGVFVKQNQADGL